MNKAACPALIDTHCHLASSRFAGEIPALLASCRAVGVDTLISQSTHLNDLSTNLALVEAYEEIFTTAGIHPCEVSECPDDFIEVLSKAVLQAKVVAVGETGLDYYHPAPEGWTDKAYRARQREFLSRHFELACEARLPVVLHTRDRLGHQSFDDALEIASEFAAEIDFVFHCFPGPPALAERALDAGAHLSFTGIASFKNASDCLESAILTPAGRIMVETDAPYLAPVPQRGKRCEPAFVRYTAECIAKARGESFADFAAHTRQTSLRFFKLDHLMESGV